MNKNITIILVEPENVDNIGAVARAMKNMKLSDLRLIKPPVGWKTKGKKMAVNAYDLLQEAKAYKSLKEAIRDRQLVIGLSRRHGYRRRDYLPFYKTIGLIKKKAKRGQCAFVFGKESKGLANEDLALCDWMTMIPANPEYGSLNLAQAVMVTAFSLYVPKEAATEIGPLSEDAAKMAYHAERTPFLRVSKQETEEVLNGLKQAFLALGYNEEGAGVVDRIGGTLDRIFSRAGLLRSEAKMFKGLARRIVAQIGQRDR